MTNPGTQSKTKLTNVSFVKDVVSWLAFHAHGLARADDWA